MTAKVRYQPIPIKEVINFKKMSGNEILLNMENCKYFSNGELTSSLIELAKRDKTNQFDWAQHPYVAQAFKLLHQRVGRFSSKNVIQTAIILDKMSSLDQALW
mmetsp:Transcript_27485/g.20648  ORF Transcript_27485/g.20648 Transcript_27485/m.20648 type:complete len:103 (+) Transcript_27485:206-514(+)